jgi:hypothetical protein
LAGITVQARNTPEGLQLTIPGAHYSTNGDGTTAAFRIDTPAVPDTRPAQAERAVRPAKRSEDGVRGNGTAEAAQSENAQ